MIRPTYDNLEDTKVIGAVDEGELQMSSSSYMLRQMQDGIYEDKIAAVVREITSNGVDASLEKAKETGEYQPVTVSLQKPGTWSAEKALFTVSDCGVGMDEETLKQNFFVVGGSTKTHTNDFAGGHGVGCKTPIGYTSEYVVETVKDGRRLKYMMFRDGNRTPWRKVLDEKTDAPSGTTVSIPVEKEDIEDFQEAIVTQLTMYWLQGRIEPKKLAKDAWTLSREEAKNERLYENDSVVIYHTDVVKTDANTHTIYSPAKLAGTFLMLDGILYKHDTKGGTHITAYKFDTGELIPTLSREGIQETSGSQEVIDRRKKAAFDQLLEDVLQDNIYAALQNSSALSKAELMDCSIALGSLSSRTSKEDTTRQRKGVLKEEWVHKFSDFPRWLQRRVIDICTSSFSVDGWYGAVKIRRKSTNKSGVSRTRSFRGDQSKKWCQWLNATHYTLKGSVSNGKARAALEDVSQGALFIVHVEEDSDLHKAFKEKDIPCIDSVDNAPAKNSGSKTSDEATPVYAYYWDSDTSSKVPTKRFVSRYNTESTVFGYIGDHDELQQSAVVQKIADGKGNVIRVSKANGKLLTKATYVGDYISDEDVEKRAFERWQLGWFVSRNENCFSMIQRVYSRLQKHKKEDVDSLPPAQRNALDVTYNAFDGINTAASTVAKNHANQHVDVEIGNRMNVRRFVSDAKKWAKSNPLSENSLVPTKDIVFAQDATEKMDALVLSYSPSTLYMWLYMYTLYFEDQYEEIVNGVS